MSQVPIVHIMHAPNASDEALAAEAQDHLLHHPPLEVLSEILQVLRDKQRPWFLPQTLLDFCGVQERLQLLAARPDVRERLLVTLIGAKPRTARRTPLPMQAEQILIAMEAQDVDAQSFDQAFQTQELALYLDAAALWRCILSRLPWEENDSADKEFVGLVVRCLLSPERLKTSWSPSGAIITPWDLLRGIDARVWNQHIPLDLRAKIHEAWLMATEDGNVQAFTPRDVLELVPPDVFMHHLKLDDLRGILLLAEKRMGFEAPPPPVEEAAPETRCEVPHSHPEASAASDSTTSSQTPDVDAMFGDDEASPAPSPMDDPDGLRKTMPPAAPVAVTDTATTVRPTQEGEPLAPIPGSPIEIPRDDSVVITVGDGDELEEIPPSDAIPLANEDLALPELDLARCLIELQGYGIQLSPEEGAQARTFLRTIQYVMSPESETDDAILQERAAALRESLHGLLEALDPKKATSSTWVGKSRTVKAYAAMLKDKLKLAKEGKTDPEVPRPRSSSIIPPSATRPPPLPEQAKAGASEPPAKA